MPPGALVLHGFTATPECMDPLIGPLQKAGFLVEAPFLAGHGTTPEDLYRTTWKDWYRGVRDSFDRLAKKADPISVVGLSLGGLLAMKLATERPVKHLALLAVPVFFKGFVMERVLPLLGGTFLCRIYRYQPKWLGSAINDPEGRRLFKSYPKMPVRSIMEIVRLQKEVKPLLPSVKAPALIVHSTRDSTVPYENMAYLKDHLGSKTVKTVMLERSNHVLPLDYDKELVTTEVVRFFGTAPDKSGRSDR